MRRRYSRPIEVLLRLAIHAAGRSFPILFIRRREYELRTSYFSLTYHTAYFYE